MTNYVQMKICIYYLELFQLISCCFITTKPLFELQLTWIDNVWNFMKNTGDYDKNAGNINSGNKFEIVFWISIIWALVLRPQCVNSLRPSDAYMRQ